MLIFREWLSNDIQLFKVVFEPAELCFLIFTVDWTRFNWSTINLGLLLSNPKTALIENGPCLILKTNKQTNTRSLKIPESETKLKQNDSTWLKKFKLLNLTFGVLGAKCKALICKHVKGFIKLLFQGSWGKPSWSISKQVTT